MSIRPYRAANYTRLPWKIGSGQTDEICLLPEGATRDSFEIRVSSAPIENKARFSTFAGTDRAITLIQGHGLVLEFDEEAVPLEPFRPYMFDTGLAPVGNPRNGRVRVVNMIVNRKHWAISETRVLTGNTRLELCDGGRVFVITLTTSCVLNCGDAQVTLAAFDSALTEGAVDLTFPEADGKTPCGLGYILAPAR